MPKFLKYSIILLFVAIILVRYLQYRENHEYINTGKQLIEKVEAYKSLNKKLPETIGDLNEPESMENGPYYNKIDDNQYEISFCFGFDDDLTYNSITKEWSGTELW